MATFEYTARNAQGQETTGTMEATSRDEVVTNLRKNRMVLVRLREAKKTKRGDPHDETVPPVPRTQTRGFCSVIAAIAVKPSISLLAVH